MAFNQLNLPAIDRAADATNINAMNMQRAERQFGEQDRVANTRWLLAVAENGMNMLESNPEQLRSYMKSMDDDGSRRGVWEKLDIDYENMSDEELFQAAGQGFQNMGQQAQIGLAGMQQQGNYGAPVAGVNAEGEAEFRQFDPRGGNRPISDFRPTPQRQSAAQQNYARRQQLAEQYGEDSPEVRVFDNYVRAEKVVDIGQVPTRVGVGSTDPLSTIESEVAGVEAIQAGKEQAITDALVPRGEQQRIVALTKSAPATYRSIKYSLTELDRFTVQAQRLRDHPGLSKATGFGGESLSGVPGTDAADAAALMETLKAKAFISALSAMRASSKTGGAVGNVSDAEGGRFENAFVALTQAQSYGQFIQELDRLIALNEETKLLLTSAYTDEYAGIETAPQFDTNGGRGAGIDNPQEEIVLQQARDAIIAGKSRTGVIEMLQGMGIDPNRL